MKNKRMTVNQLHKQLSKLMEQGRGRQYVNINKSSFTHPLEGDGCVILPVYECGLEWVTTGDDDGGIKINKDGGEAGSTILVLKGIES